MQGTGGNFAKITMVPTKHKVKKGDYVYADLKVGFLNDQVITGKITKCRRDDQHPTLWDITVEPVCDLENLQNVTVIITDPL